MKLFLCSLSKSEILFFLGQRNNLRDFFFGQPCFSAKIELHFTLNYAAHVNQDVNRKVYTLAVSVGIPCKKYRCP